MPKCEICEKEFKQINSAHLKTHDYTLTRYRKEFPNAVTFPEVKFTKEHREKIGIAMMGHTPWNKDMSKEEWLTHFKNGEHPRGMLGKEHTEKAKQKIGIKGKGRIVSKKTRKLMSKIMNGRIPWHIGLTRFTDERVAKMSRSLLKYYKTHDSLIKGLTKETSDQLARSSVSMTLYWRNLIRFNFGKYLVYCKNMSVVMRAVVADPNFVHWQTKLTIEKLKVEYNIPEGTIFSPASTHEHLFARSLIDGKPISPQLTSLPQHPRAMPRYPGDIESNPYASTAFPTEEEEYGWIDGKFIKLLLGD